MRIFLDLDGPMLDNRRRYYALCRDADLLAAAKPDRWCADLLQVALDELHPGG